MNADITPATRLTFLPLSVVPDGDAYVVGCPETGSFVAMPQLGVRLLEHLQQGMTVGAAAAALAREGLDVDAADFAAAMVEAGLARVYGDAPLTHQQATAGLAFRVLSRWAAPLFSPVAWTLYGCLLAYAVAVLAVRPRYWPAVHDFFFHPSTGISLAVMAAVGWCQSAMHELFHGLAGRTAGVPVRFRFSRRLFLPVLETDLSGLWSLPRRRRYGPLLAGMVWDSLTLAVCLTLRLLQDAGLVALPVPGLPAAVALLAVTQLGWQCLIFMRTDLYAVMVTLLGCRNLYRVTYLVLKRTCYRLQPAEAAELARSDARDLQVAGWFSWVYLAGLAWAIYFFLRYFLPGIWIALRWAISTLAMGGVARADFWLALAVGLLTAVQLLGPAVLYLRERMRS